MERVLIRILIVDDHPEVRETIRLGLRTIRRYQYEFLEASNGREALAMLEAGPEPDVVVTDIMMPEMDGFDFLRAVRARQDWRHIPAVVLSAKRGAEDILRALRIGAADFLTKPFHHQEIHLRMRRVIDLALRLKVSEISKAMDRELGNYQARRRTVADLEESRTFRIANLKDVFRMCDLIVHYYPLEDRDRVWMGLEEVLLNAIIHGNLEVSSAVKNQPDGEAKHERVVRERSETPPYSERWVSLTVEILRRPEGRAVRVSVRDQGPGFDPASLPDPSAINGALFDTHGRGVLLAGMAFDSLTYEFPPEGGTLAVMVRGLPPEE